MSSDERWARDRLEEHTRRLRAWANALPRDRAMTLEEIGVWFIVLHREAVRHEEIVNALWPEKKKVANG
jgi:hypothetical protein